MATHTAAESALLSSSQNAARRARTIAIQVRAQKPSYPAGSPGRDVTMPRRRFRGEVISVPSGE